MVARSPLWNPAPPLESRRPRELVERTCRENLPMDIDLKDVLSFLQDTARQFGAEITSPWFYLQFGLILAGAGIALANEPMVRARVDMNSLALRWPLPLRHFARVMVSSSSTAVFAVLMI